MPGTTIFEALGRPILSSGFRVGPPVPPEPMYKKALLKKALFTRDLGPKFRNRVRFRPNRVLNDGFFILICRITYQNLAFQMFFSFWRQLCKNSFAKLGAKMRKTSEKQGFDT